MKPIHCQTCQNRGCSFKQKSATSSGLCYGYEPKLKLSGVEVFVLDRILSLTGNNNKCRVTEINEKEDGLVVVDTNTTVSITEGIELLSDIIPDDDVLSEVHWLNQPEIDIWNDIKERLHISRLYKGEKK